jgi:hypothetical protein
LLPQQQRLNRRQWAERAEPIDDDADDDNEDEKKAAAAAASSHITDSAISEHERFMTAKAELEKRHHEKVAKVCIKNNFLVAVWRWSQRSRASASDVVATWPYMAMMRQ